MGFTLFKLKTPKIEKRYIISWKESNKKTLSKELVLLASKDKINFTSICKDFNIATATPRPAG